MGRGWGVESSKFPFTDHGGEGKEGLASGSEKSLAFASGRV